MKRPSRPKKRIAPKKAVKRKAPKRKSTRKAADKIIAVLKEAVEVAAGRKRPARWRVINPEMSIEDAAVFDIPQPPPGMAYQWSPLGRLEYMLMKGWSRVPYSRHPALPRNLSFDGYIVYRDMTLFQIDYSVYAAERDRHVELAKDQVRDFEAATERGIDQRGGSFRIMPSDFVVSSDYGAVPDSNPPMPVTVPITIMVPTRWQDAAAACRLDIGTYTKRRLTEDGMMIAADERAIFHPFVLTTRKVD